MTQQKQVMRGKRRLDGPEQPFVGIIGCRLAGDVDRVSEVDQ